MIRAEIVFVAIISHSRQSALFSAESSRDMLSPERSLQMAMCCKKRLHYDSRRHKTKFISDWNFCNFNEHKKKLLKK
jgi:hypothetical protein